MAWQRVAKTSELEEGVAKEIVVDHQVIAIARYQSQVFAIEGMCAHQGGPLGQGTVADGCIRCPWHGWQYLLENGFNAVTCQPMLNTFPTREVDGWIEIEPSVNRA